MGIREFLGESVASGDLVVVLAAGLLSGILCRRWNIPTVVGYLIAGGLIGPHVLGLVGFPPVGPDSAGISAGFTPSSARQLEDIAQLGALLLLFSVGIELSLEGFWELRREFLLGGAVQTLLTAVPATLVGWSATGQVGPAILVGVAVANSSTVLVFKALEEWGQVGTAAGRRTLAILLFGDIVLIPFLLLVPFLTGEGPFLAVQDLLVLSGQFFLLVLAVPTARYLIGSLALERLARLRSIELLVLFTIAVFATVCWLAYELGLPPAIGALAAGLIFGGGRWSRQIDAVTLPFREAAAAVFFVGLGTVMRPSLAFEFPLGILISLIALVVVKAAAGGIALRFTGLAWRSSFALGTAMAQMSEFSFLLLFTATRQGALSHSSYEFLLLLAVLSLIITPQLVRWALPYVEQGTQPRGKVPPRVSDVDQIPQAVVIGAGPIGRRIAAQLETMGVDVCLVDLSPVNLYAFAQQGFRTVVGDGQQAEVLEHAGVPRASLVVITVPDDQVAMQVVRQVRSLSKKVPVLVRCRYQANVGVLKKTGATGVVAEEVEATTALLQHLIAAPGAWGLHLPGTFPEGDTPTSAEEKKGKNMQGVGNPEESPPNGPFSFE